MRGPTPSTPPAGSRARACAATRCQSHSSATAKLCALGGDPVLDVAPELDSQEPRSAWPSGRQRSGALESFGGEVGHQDRQSCDVPAGPSKARNVASPYWICMSQEDDGDRRCRLFRRLHPDRGPSHDQIHLEPNQVSSEFRKSSGVALGSPELDRDVLAPRSSRAPASLTGRLARDEPSPGPRPYWSGHRRGTPFPAAVPRRQRAQRECFRPPW